MESVRKVNENCIDFGVQRCNFLEKDPRLKCSEHQRRYRQLSHEKARYSNILGDIASDSKVYINEKEKYVMQMAQRRQVFSLAYRVYLKVSAQHRQ